MNIYEDIAKRTQGDIYIGVVGPVRTGKSTFIRKFMETLVLPNIENEFKRDRTRDEIPQSGSGKTIMTVEPKFVPADGVVIQLKDSVSLKVRMVDCVGYIVEGALGHEENGKQRLVSTPWSKDAMTFEEAAEIGTKKVIRDHSTICVVESPKDVFAMEKVKEYHGLYHVLHGTISIIDGKTMDDLNIQSLFNRLDDQIKEVIIATNPTREGETTALFLSKLLNKKNITTSRIANGLPIGSNIDYADELTLLKSLEGRKKM